MLNLQAPTGLGTLSITSATMTACGTFNNGANPGIAPKMDFVVGSGGTVIDAYPGAAVNGLGLANGSGCTFVVPASAGGTPGHVTVTYGNTTSNGGIAVPEGFGGMGSSATDNNLKSVGVYRPTLMIPGKSSCSVSGELPLTSSGYCEPDGCLLCHSGLSLGAQVSG